MSKRGRKGSNSSSRRGDTWQAVEGVEAEGSVLHDDGALQQFGCLLALIARDLNWCRLEQPRAVQGERIIAKQ